ncbi:hypothetical protein [Gracilinema caldarium]|uniref:hypothetical protein n=1 Tax=Gracilinema caldarium TaxID=215591 RepID=UPI0026EFCE28|nr:hypothetical protein [Gracilinema caldarium]
MKLTLNNGAFELLDQKITDIQIALDKGLLNPETALRYIREARAELFLLRQILKNEVVIDNPGPDAPEAA